MPYISRFNEQGKKSKSKGNHIGHVDAKRIEGGTWNFCPFQRKLADTPLEWCTSTVLRWAWMLHIWDPQASRANLPIKYSSLLLPSGLSWKNDCLSSVPLPNA
ncbi:hypothetical protein A0H81_06576 [Grifola frondosa]|uniref:Uncharacterized protein n=1 Tax=Grifola frondosa TaxID=5627 RepID=A0A1C7M9Z5_GRIFR|nr:hypothetical protein A0H81_06576 [Grifola frondosa]